MGSTKKVLVSGLGGFIGRHTAPLLLKQGFEVCAFGRGDKPAHLDDGIEWRRLDFLDFAATNALVHEVRPSHFLNLAWYTEHGKFWRAPENAKCVLAGLNLLIAFRESGGHRFVGAGTCAEYDWDYGFLSEDSTPRRPSTPFGRSKNALFEASASYGDTTEVSFAWGRVFFVYGPHEDETRLVSSVIISLLAGKRAKCSPGLQVRDFSHVEDVAASFVALLESDVAGAVNLASGNPVPVRLIVETIAEEIGRPDLLDIGAMPMPEGDPPVLAADVRKLRDQVGAQPIYDLKSGLSATIDFYRNGGGLVIGPSIDLARIEYPRTRPRIQ